MSLVGYDSIGIIPATTALVPIVHTEGNRVFATSKDVAEFFEKRHDHVLRDINALVEQGVPNFGEASYVEVQNKQAYRMFEMDRDGFTLLAMGFTGPKALKFKLAYIAAFNEAITRLKELESKSATPAIPTSFAEALRLAADEFEKRVAAEEAQKVAEEVGTPADVLSERISSWISAKGYDIDILGFSSLK